MEDNFLETYHAIKNFVEDLWEVFGDPKEIEPLTLYKRLLSRIDSDSPPRLESVRNVISGFQTFLEQYDQLIIDDQLGDIPEGTTICYGTKKNINIEIQKYIQHSDEETRNAIRYHLLAISAILNPNDEKRELIQTQFSLPGVDGSTREGQFINGIMAKAKDTMEGTDMDSPAQAVMGLMSSGIITDMITGLQTGVASGEMDIAALMGAMQTALGGLTQQAQTQAPPPPQTATVEEISEENESSN